MSIELQNPRRQALQTPAGRRSASRCRAARSGGRRAGQRRPAGPNAIVEFLVYRGTDLLAESREGWTPLRIADGVHYTGAVKRADHTAELLRRYMREQGVYRAEHERAVNSVAVVRPAGGQ